MSNDLQRFLSKVSKTKSCWLWVGSFTRKGYGQFRYMGKMRGAHRVSYQLFIGTIPIGLHVLHTCDNKACVNPDHLFVGTNLDNVRDKIAKGRDNKGEVNGMSKLTSAKVRVIAKLLKKGVKGIIIARVFGIHPVTICDIKRGKNWSWLTGFPVRKILS